MEDRERRWFCRRERRRVVEMHLHIEGPIYITVVQSQPTKPDYSIILTPGVPRHN